MGLLTMQSEMFNTDGFRGQGLVIAPSARVEKSLRVPLPPAPDMRNVNARAERLLAEYLRHWGLRDPSTIARQCRRWVQRANADVQSINPKQLTANRVYRA